MPKVSENRPIIKRSIACVLAFALAFGSAAPASASNGAPSSSDALSYEESVTGEGAIETGSASEADSALGADSVSSMNGPSVADSSIASDDGSLSLDDGGLAGTNAQGGNPSVSGSLESDQASGPSQGVAAPDVSAGISDEPASSASTVDSDAFPAQVLNTTLEDGKASVVIEADEGVLPEGSTVELKLVSDHQVLDAVADTVNGAGGQAGQVKAFDVTLRDAAGVEIQPAGKVKVSFSGTAMPSDDVSVYHVSDDVQKVEQVRTDKAESDSQVFEAEHFSVYAIAETGAAARLKLVFHQAGSADVTSIVVKKSDNLEAILYEPEIGSLQGRQSFRGWTTDPHYTKDSVRGGIEAVRELVRQRLDAADFKDGDTLDFYPLVLEYLKVSYLDENESVLGVDTVFLNPGEAAVPYVVNMSYTPGSSVQDFEGWKVHSGGDGIAGHAPDANYENGTRLEISRDVVFSVNAPRGHWLVFDENGKNATYNAPEFVKDGELAREPSLPMKRAGYEFGGWYTDKACSPGSEFRFGEELTDNTTVYAKWIPDAESSYTVIIWKQKVSGDGYDFAESIAMNGRVGEAIDAVVPYGSGNNAYVRVDGERKQYAGFHLRDFDRDVVVETGGASQLNVYYDRNQVTLTFQHRGHYGWVIDRVMTGLYGSTLESNGYAWPTDYWWYSGYDRSIWDGSYVAAGTRYTFLDSFILPSGSSLTLYGFDGYGTNHIYFYKQNAAGGWSLANDVASSSSTFSISDKYGGYRAVSYSRDGRNWTQLGNKNPLTGYYATVSGWNRLYIRYAPKSYSLVYKDGAYLDGEGRPVPGYADRGVLKEVDDIAYGSDMSAYGEGGSAYYEPSYEGFSFGGWYADEDCTQPYVFGTMPEGVTVYAKWVQTQYRVFLHPNSDADDTLDWGSESQPMSFLATHGDKISTPTGMRSGYEFVGWYLDKNFTRPFNAKAFVLNDTTVTTPYDKSVDMTGPLDKHGMPGPNPYNEDAIGFNGSDRFWVTKKLDLYAKWRKVLVGAKGIKLVYDVGEGSGAPVDDVLYLDNSDAVAGAAPAAPEGKRFMYWVIQTWDEGQGAYRDLEDASGGPVKVFAGDAFAVLKDNAKVVEKADSTPEHPSYSYTVQLRAEYGDEGSPSLVKTVFDANGGSFADGTRVEGMTETNQEISVPLPPSRLGYVFKGWSASADGASFIVQDDPMLEGRYAADGLSGLAWNDQEKANVIYAVWEREPIVVTGVKDADAAMTPLVLVLAVGLLMAAASVSLTRLRRERRRE